MTVAEREAKLREAHHDLALTAALWCEAKAQGRMTEELDRRLKLAEHRVGLAARKLDRAWHR